MSSLRFISHFKLAEYVPLDDRISFKDLAEKAGVDERRIKPILRQAMTNNLFREPEAGYVAHTAESSLLVRQKGMRDWVGYTSEETFPASAKLVEATEKYGVSDVPGETAYNIAFDTPLPVWEHVALFPERAARFANTMNEMLSTDGYHIRHLVNGFDWQGLADGTTVVDVRTITMPIRRQMLTNIIQVGGSFGHASVAIAKQAKQLNFIVQDQPEIVAQGQKILESERDEQVKARIKFEEHDFFTPQPDHGAAVYLLRFILHDHPDRIAANILKNIALILKPGARLVVMDGVLPEPNTILKSEERMIRYMDLEMTTSFGGRERERADWEALFAMGDERFKLKDVEKPPGSVNSVIEVVFDQK